MQLAAAEREAGQITQTKRGTPYGIPLLNIQQLLIKLR
jgi:hypothetical protein